MKDMLLDILSQYIPFFSFGPFDLMAKKLQMTNEKLCQAKWPIFGFFLWVSLFFEHFP